MSSTIQGKTILSIGASSGIREATAKRMRPEARRWF